MREGDLDQQSEMELLFPKNVRGIYMECNSADE